MTTIEISKKQLESAQVFTYYEARSYISRNFGESFLDAFDVSFCSDVEFIEVIDTQYGTVLIESCIDDVDRENIVKNYSLMGYLIVATGLVMRKINYLLED